MNMTRRKLLIASPAKGGIAPIYVKLFERLIRDGVPGWSCEYVIESAQNALNISRSILANDAIVGGFDRVLFHDTDHPTTVDHVTRILSHDHDEFQIVSGLYCMKRPGKPFFLGVKSKGAHPRPDGLLEADFLPTGFLSVSVDALRTMRTFHKDREVFIQDDYLLPPGPRETKGTLWELFPIGINGDRTPAARMRKVRAAMQQILELGVTRASKPQMLAALQGVSEAITAEGTPGYLTGEDFYFTKLARDAGLRCWLDLKCMVPHTGTITYPIIDPAVLATSCDSIPEAEGDQTTW